MEAPVTLGPSNTCVRVYRAAKRVKGNKGGTSKGGSPGKSTGNSGHPTYKSAGDVREGYSSCCVSLFWLRLIDFHFNETSGACCRGAYSQETREIILSLDRATKTAPNGKQILKNVGVGMYLGAKIGFLGQNGSRLLLCCFIRHP